MDTKSPAAPEIEVIQNFNVIRGRGPEPACVMLVQSKRIIATVPVVDGLSVDAATALAWQAVDDPELIGTDKRIIDRRLED